MGVMSAEYMRNYMRTHPEAAERKRASARATYAWYREHGICVHCHQRNAVEGHSQCEVCREDARARWRKHRSEYNAMSRDSKRRSYTRNKEQGLCVRCGKEPAIAGQCMCAPCRDRFRKYYGAGV